MKTEVAFLSIQNATIKQLGKTLFQNLNFTVKNGESWAILAASGKEKTAFLETLLGRTAIVEGKIFREFAKDYQQDKSEKGEINSFRDLMSIVTQKYPFKNKSNQQNFYYQQRFNSSESEEAATVAEHLCQVNAPIRGYWDRKKVMELFNLNQLADKSLIKLSNGESRRLGLATAVLKNPKLLLLDMPLTGLDVATRGDFDRLLQLIIQSGIQVIMTTSVNEIPASIHKIGIIRNGQLEEWVDKSNLKLPEAWGSENRFTPNRSLSSLLADYPRKNYQIIVKLNRVTIRYGNKIILNQVDWLVKPGDRWLVKGHNGAGKSTLISLVLGENPQAYANDILLFDRKRGTGESIWDVKKPMGFVSPELSRYFPANQTCLKVVLSGLFDTMGLFRKILPAQEKLGMEWLDAFGLSHLANLGLRQISLEEQRLCLLARAMIKHPQLLVLDEAAQGMDDEMRLYFKNTVDQIVKQTGLTLIYVSHYQEDVPDSVDKILNLEERKVKSIITNINLDK
ncbi:MAG: ATP-binding cassette domain-containing protein [Cyclobacteriaceae bacterium]